MADDIIPTKTCLGRWGCGETKPVSEFPLHDTTGRPRSPCKACEKKRQQEKSKTPAGRAASNRRAKRYQQAHPERIRAIGRRWRETLRSDLVKWVTKTTLHNTRHQARKQGVECTLTGADIGELHARQEGRCALTGREIIFGSKGRQRDSISLDRIEHGGDYTLGNVRLVTYQANMARGMFSDEELRDFCIAHLTTIGYLLFGQGGNDASTAV